MLPETKMFFEFVSSTYFCFQHWSLMSHKAHFMQIIETESNISSKHFTNPNFTFASRQEIFKLIKNCIAYFPGLTPIY